MPAKRAVEFYEMRCWNMDVRVYWGKGSPYRWIKEEFDSDDILFTNMRDKMLNYDYERVVVIEDFNHLDCTAEDYSFLYQLTENTPMDVEARSGIRPLLAKVVIVTSTLCPWMWFPHNEQWRVKFNDRIGTIYHFPAPRY